MKRLTLFLLGLGASALAQTPLNLEFAATATLAGTSYSFHGTGTITGLGVGALSGGGAIDPSLLSGTPVGVVPGSFSLIYPDGAMLIGTFNIPTGILVPQSGGTTTPSGSVTITGGTGRLEGSRGVFSPVTGTGTVTSLTTASMVITSTGTLSTAQYVLPQFVFGGGWYTALYFANSKTTPATVQVNFIAEDGTPLNVPALGGSSSTANIPAGGSARIEAPNTGDLKQGYATVTLPEGVTGYAVFRQSVAGTPDQEAVVPLSNSASSSSTFVFDDTNYTTGAGIVNPSSVATTVTITARSANGGSLGTATIPLAAKSKTAVSLRTLTGLSGIANNRGSLTFTTTTGNVAVLGLRFFGSAFTSIPATDR
jgi:hypothetical protein